jgi:hypothetical protein
VRENRGAAMIEFTILLAFVIVSFTFGYVLGTMGQEDEIQFLRDQIFDLEQRTKFHLPSHLSAKYQAKYREN